MPESIFSKNIKTKSNTYFFDVKEAKNGSKYLVITESKFKDGQKMRNSLIVFSDNLKQFCETLDEMKEQVGAKVE